MFLSKISKEFKIEKTSDMSILIASFTKEYALNYCLKTKDGLHRNFENDKDRLKKFESLKSKLSFNYPNSFFCNFLNNLNFIVVDFNQEIFKIIRDMSEIQNDILKCHIKNIIEEVFNEVGLSKSDGYDPLNIF